MFGSSSLGGGLGGGGFGEPPQKKLKLDLPGSPVADKDDEMGPLAEGSSTTVQGSGSSVHDFSNRHGNEYTTRIGFLL